MSGLAARVKVTVGQLERNQSLMARSLADVDQQTSLVRAGEAGNHLNWLTGHVVVSRNGLLVALGGESLVPAATVDKYRRSAPLPVAEEEDITELAELAEATAQGVAAALQAAGDDVLDAPSPLQGKTLLEYAEFLVWHDTYHTGQAAVYRRLAGLPGVIG